MKILIAEDDACSQAVVRAIVLKSGHEPITTGDGLAAYEMLSRPDAPKIAILDWMLPGMDGVEVCRRIRETQTDEPVYIIILTHRSEREDVVCGLQAGANDYLVKPCNAEELRARLGVGCRVVDLQRKLAEHAREQEAVKAELAHTVAAQALTLAALRERVKELTCLYAIAALIEKEDSLERVLQGTADAMPKGWGYPDIACARIYVDGKEYPTERYQETAWRQAADIKVRNRPVGMIELCYLEERPMSDEGPFQKEERALINAIAERLGRIIERKQAVERERETNAYLEGLINYANVPIIVWDTQFRVIRFNGACESLTGRAAGEVTGNNMQIIFPSDEAERSMHLIAIASMGARLSTVEIAIQHIDGTLRLVLWNSASIVDWKGNIIATIAQGHDITERKHGEEALRQQRQELFHLERAQALGELSSSLAHEISQPLAGILSNAQAALQLLESERPDLREIGGSLDDIVADDKRIAAIISRLRSLLRKEDPKRAPVDLGSVIRNVFVLVQGELALGNTMCFQECAEGLPLISGDLIQIEQVLINLIMNAQQAMASIAACDRRLVVSTMLGDPGFVIIAVQDTGPGIGEEDLTQIFDPFYTTKADGLGMGLAISRSIVEAHGGRLWAENNPTGGARLSVSLPTAGVGKPEA